MTAPSSDSEEIKQLRQRIKELEDDNARLLHSLQQLKAMLFAPRSERHIAPDDGKHVLPFPAAEPAPVKPPHVDEAPDDECETVTFKRRKRGATRISKDLPRDVTRLELPEDQRLCPCCGKVMAAIGEDRTERIDYVPAVCRVLETQVVKYACKDHEEAGVRTAKQPKHPIEGGMPTAGLVSQVVTGKYKDHQPLHRQAQIFARHGVEISESTLCDWVKHTALMLTPVVASMKASILQSKVIQSDDTGITVLDKTHPNGSRRSFLWAYVGDRAEVVFDFTHGRDQQGPTQFLGGFQGYLQADAYSGYNAVIAKGSLTQVGCWAHARRRFFKALEQDKEHAPAAMQVIGRIYQVERDAKGRGLAEAAIRELRQEAAKPLLEAMHPWLVQVKKAVLPKSPIGDAVGYALNQWSALTRYLEAGFLDIDNNRVERQMRAVAVGRKNWMFAGSAEGGVRAAQIYSVMCTCGLLSIEPWAYLKDVLQRIAEGEDPGGLTPRLWLAARASPQPVG